MNANSRGTMAAIEHGAEVLVIERHSYLHACEGRVISTTNADTVPVAIVQLTDEQGRSGRHRLPLSYLGRMPIVGARYRWDAGHLGRTIEGPFIVGGRFEAGHQLAGMFRLMSDDADPFARERGHDGIASAAELAKYAVLVEEPDGADDGTTGETVTTVEPPKCPKDLLDTLRDVVLETALSWEATVPSDPGNQARATNLRLAIRAYRTARDS